MRLGKIGEIFSECRVISDGNFIYLGKLNALEEYETLVFVGEEKYIAQLSEKRVSCVITTHELSKQIANVRSLGIIETANPKEFFYRVHEYLLETNYYFSNFNSKVDPSAKISSTAVIADTNVVIGKNTIIEELVVIKPNTFIGDNCVIRSGTVVGTEGFEVVKMNGIQKIIPHAGKVFIGNNVQLEANNTISKGLFPSRNTSIGDEVMTDNLVHIAHGVKIGARTRIAASAMIAGSVDIGEDVWIGPSAVISSGIKIGNNASITLGAVVTRSVESEKRVSGNFAIDHTKFIEFIKSIR